MVRLARSAAAVAAKQIEFGNTTPEGSGDEDAGDFVVNCSQMRGQRENTPSDGDGDAVPRRQSHYVHHIWSTTRVIADDITTEQTTYTREGVSVVDADDLVQQYIVDTEQDKDHKITGDACEVNVVGDTFSNMFDLGIGGDLDDFDVSR